MYYYRFPFICRKKKWGNKDKHSKSRSGDDGEFGSPSTNASQAWIDPTPYLCAVHEVVGNKAYEYFFGQDGNNENITSEEVEAEMSYELFADGNRDNSRNKSGKSIKLSNVIIENSEPRRFFGRKSRRFRVNKRKRKTVKNRPNNKAEMISTSIDKSTNADQSVEGNDTYQKEMNEINKLAIP